MSPRHLRSAVVALAVVSGSSVVLDAQKPAAADVLKAAGDYLVQYAEKVGTLIAEEELTHRDTSAVNLTRRLLSDVVFVGTSDGAVAMFRDPHTVDGTAVRSRDERLVKLFAGGAAASAEEQALLFAEEGVRYYLSPNLRSLDTPTLALEFLREPNQAQSEFEVEGVKKQDGAQVATVKFKARPDAKVLPTPDGSSTSGRFWIDVATGAVRQSEVTVSSKQFTYKVTAKYAHDKTLDMWLPKELVQQIEISGAGTGGFSNMGQGGGMGARQSLDGRANYSKYRRP